MAGEKGTKRSTEVPELLTQGWKEETPLLGAGKEASFKISVAVTDPWTQ